MNGDDQTSATQRQLTVLPSSGKVDELRRQFESERTAGITKSQATLMTNAEPSAPSTADAVPTPTNDVSPAEGKSIAQKLVEGKVIAALRQVFDPEIPVNIYDLGLIYEIDVAEDNRVKVKMTLTAPACPVAGTLPGEVERKIETVPEVTSAEVELVWEPAWSRDRMSEDAMLTLGFF